MNRPRGFVRWLVLVLVVAAVRGLGEPGAAADRLSLPVLKDLHGKDVPFTAPEKGVTVVVFYSIECPIANAFLPELQRLSRQFPAKVARTIAVCVDPDRTRDDILEHAREYVLDWTIVLDPAGTTLARRLGATVTPEAFVLDASGSLRYHGRIDDRFTRRGTVNNTPQSHDLRDAVSAILAGKPVAVPHVPAVGCPLPEPPRTRPPQAP